MPDLATTLGKASDGNKTWTYTLRDGLKYEDGTPDHEQGHQVRRRAPARQGHVPQRPDVLQRLPRRRPGGLLGLQGQEPRQPQVDRDARRQDDRLPPQQAVRRLRLLRPAVRPRPPCRRPRTPARSTRSTSSRAARTSSRSTRRASASSSSATTSTTPQTDPDTGRKALPDKLTVEIGLNAADLDNRLMAGDLDIDLAGTGVQAAAQGKILADPTLKANTDNADDRACELRPDQQRRRAVRQHRLPQGRHLRLRQDGLPARLRRRHRWHIATGLLPPIVPGYSRDGPLQLQGQADR